MEVEVVERKGSTVTLAVTVDVGGSLLQAEEAILEACNGLGCRASAEALKRYDTDGSSILTGDVKWTSRCQDNKVYQTPYGPVEVKRHVYQTSRGGKIYCPLESSARIIRGATPRFAKIVAHKYAHGNAEEVRMDLESNHGRSVAKSYLQNIAESVGAIAQAKEESWSYATPELGAGIMTVVVSLGGAHLLTCDDGWQEAMVGAISLYDGSGDRQHTIYIGAGPEYGKVHFIGRLEQEIAHVKALYPEALYLGIADAAKDGWPLLEKHADWQLLDYFHVTECLARVAYAAHPRKAAKPLRKQWLHERCHQLKHDPQGAQALLQEMQGYRRRNKLSVAVKDDLRVAIAYFEDHLHLMNYAEYVEENLPIGSGVTEAACKTLIKQRFCRSGMRWKHKGVKVVLSLRELAQTTGRWEQFWSKIDQYGGELPV